MKVTEKQKDFLASNGYKDFSKSTENGNFIFKYPAEDKNKVNELINSQYKHMKR